MRCPFCHVDNDRVIDTRATEDGYVVRRKRVCGSCHRKFMTLERLEEASVRVVKRDQTREPLDREKIRRGIERACSKRPISSQQIESLVQEIETEIHAGYDLEVPTTRIGEIVMRALARTDEVAYIRFASVYREFEDARDFFNAIETFRPANIAAPHDF
jgi:transcriptional repressor NrdR